MGETDVAIALTTKLDKLMRETLKMLPHGEEAIEILNSMFVREQAGWRLYHNDAMSQDPSNAWTTLEGFLESCNDEEDQQAQMNWLELWYEEDEHFTAHRGGHEDPFNLGYVFKIQYTEEKWPKPKKKKQRSAVAKRRGRKRRGGR